MNYLQKSCRIIAWLLPTVAWVFLAGSAASVRAQDFDDDGEPDETERYYGWLEQRSESPYVMRALNFSGGGDVTVTEDMVGVLPRYAATNWTVEVWARPTQNVAGFVPLVRREIAGLRNFEVGLTFTNGQTRIYTRVSRGDAAGNPFYEVVEGAAVPLNEWTHMAATFRAPTASANGAFILYKNGGEVARGRNTRITSYVGAGLGQLHLGSAGFVGDLMEVRVWSVVRTPQDILDNYRRVLLNNTDARENSFAGGAAGTYLGRATQQATPPTVTLSEDGYTYSRVAIESAAARTRITQRYTMEAWIKMDPGSRGGVVARRKVNEGSALPIENAGDAPLASDLVVGGDDPANGWSVCYSMNVLPNGNLQAEWWGIAGTAADQRLKRRFLRSDVDLRDGQWHHVAVVGNTVGVTLYIDGIPDVLGAEYFYFVQQAGGGPMPVIYTQYKTVNSILRIGQGGFDGTIDEVLIWNTARTVAEINQEMQFGLTQAEITANRVGFAWNVPPVPTGVTLLAADGGSAASPNRYRLVSYVIIDTTNPGATFVDDFAAPGIPYRILPVPSGTEIVSGGRPPIVADTLGRAYARIMPGYFPGSDGGLTVENYIARNVLAAAGVFGAGAAFAPLDHNLPADTGHMFLDSDNDGMPDWWETAHGLNSLANDAFEDPDGDGLPNVAEFRADIANGGTITDPVSDPWSGDTNGDGNGDFYSWNNAIPNDFRIFGERYTDFDGIADRWEVGSGLDPMRFEAVEDPDQDGWSNLAEFMGGVAGDCTFTQSTDPWVTTNAPLPTLTFTFKYNGTDATGPMRIFAYHSAAMDGQPDATLTVSAGTYVFPLSVQRRGTNAGSVPFGTITNVTSTGTVREGSNWFFAFFDKNSDGTWNVGEPAGVAEGQPVNVGWGNVADIVIGLTKAQANADLRDFELAGYGRFAWPSAGSTSYRVRVRTTAGIELLSRELAGPRTFFHEGDFRYAGVTGLTEMASWQWYVYVTNNTQPYASGNFGVKYPASHAAPTPVEPAGSILRNSGNTLVWTTTTPQDTEFLVQIARDVAFSDRVYSGRVVAPFREKDGKHRFILPSYAGDGVFTNGTYYWRVQGINKKSVSSFSAESSFRVDLTASGAGPFELGGEIIYPGKVSNGTWIVQAFLSVGLGGKPVAQTRAANAATVAGWPRNRTPFLLRGLPRGTYYVRAFLDQNGDEKPAVWETQGYVAGFCRYAPADLMVPASRYTERLETMIRDTDNDKIADDWEYFRFGNLTDAGPGGSPGGYTSYLNGLLGIDDYDAYAATPMNLNPTDPDAHLADGVPIRIKTALGLDPLALLEFGIKSIGLDGGAASVVTWEAVPGGTARIDSAGKAVKEMGSAELSYQLQQSADMSGWTDVQTGGVLEYDVLRNEFRFTAGPDVAGPVFYRYRVLWSD